MLILNPTQTELAIEVSDLKKVFRKREGLFGPLKEEWALKGVSFHVRKGETYALLGPNGSGKSTLIRILSTLLTPDGGTVRMLGYRLPEDEAKLRRKMGRVSVDAAFYKKLSARENLLYAAQLYGLEPRQAEKGPCRFWSSWAWSPVALMTPSRR